MFKLCSVLLAVTLLAYAAAEVQLLVPDNNLVSGKSVQSISPSASAAAVAANGINAPDEQAEDSSDESNVADAPPARSRSASNRATLLLASAGGVQHQVLPAEAIPLPITISARAGLRTILAPETITIHQPTIAKIGEVVQQIPTAVSHQSQTVVHKHARVVTPIVAPAVRSVTSQVVRAIHQPLVYAPQTRIVSVLGH